MPPPSPGCGSRVLLSPSSLPCPTYFQGHSWGAATPLYSGNMITSGRVCYSFATRAIGVQMTLEKHSISRNSSPWKGRCAHCSLKTCLSRAWPPSGCTRELGSGLAQDRHLPTSHWPRSRPGPQGIPQGPSPFSPLCSCPGL